MEIFVPSVILPRHSVTLRDPSCVLAFNGSHHVISVGLGQCGTTVEFTDESVVFRNEMSAYLTSARSNPNLVSFGDAGNMTIPIECEYPRRANVTMSYLPIRGKLRIFEKRFGHLEFQLSEFSDDTFRSKIPSTSLPFQVPLNHEIHVELSVSHATVPDIGIFADKCLATPTASPNDPTFWPLIENGCSVQNEVRIHHLSSVKEFRFSFNAFKFPSTDPTSSPSLVYVHCQVSACRLPDCVTSCQGHSRNRRRRRASIYSSHLVSSGPYLVTSKRDPVDSTPSPAVFVSTGVALVASVVAVIAIIAWKKTKGRELSYNRLPQELKD